MNFTKEIIRAFVLGIGIFITMWAIFLAQGKHMPEGEFWVEFWTNQLFSIPLYLVNTYVFTKFKNRYGKTIFEIKNLSIVAGISVIVTVVTIFLIRFFLLVAIYEKSVYYFLQNERVGYYKQAFFISVVITAGFYALVYWKQRQENKVKVSEIKAGTVTAQFDALKNQLDPHFLFNSLNVLTSLIEENPDQAQRFTTSLSKVYRYVLEQKSKELVTVDEELAFARTYMRLIKMRFEDSIIIDIPDQASNPEAKVVPLSLQLLLENAVKHNMVTPSKKLHIKIFEENGNLFVSNNKQPKKVIKKSSGVGLQNIKQRYQLLTDRMPKIYEEEHNFAVGIPMLTKRVGTHRKAQETYIEDKRYERAKEKFKAQRDFYIHFAIYLLMVPVFLYLNYISTSFFWALFPIFGWGIGVLANAAEAFEWSFFFGKAWEERKIKEYMDKGSR